MNDDETTHEVLAAVNAAVPSAHMRTPLEHIVSTARSRRRRRGLAGLTGAGLAAGIGLTLALSPVGAGGAGNTVTRPGNIQLAAWTVQASPDGTVTLTIRQLLDAPGLQRTLAQHGVPAIVHFGVECSAAGKALPLSELKQVLGLPTRIGQRSQGPIVIRINPAMMPKGSKLDVSVLHGKGGVDLVPPGDSVTCHLSASSS